MRSPLKPTVAVDILRDISRESMPMPRPEARDSILCTKHHAKHTSKPCRYSMQPVPDSIGEADLAFQTGAVL